MTQGRWRLLDKLLINTLYLKEYNPPKPKPLSKAEKIQVSRFRSLLTNIHEGPLYTVLGENVRVGKPTASSAASFDPFEGMPTYSQKYTKRRRRIPKLDTRPYILKFFPKELWSTLNPSSESQNGADMNSTGKKLQLSTVKRSDRLAGLDGEENISGDEEAEDTAERNLDGDETPAEEEDLDDEYEDDEEGGDYNAEQYFDDGGDDAGDDYDGGGDAEGGDYY